MAQNDLKQKTVIGFFWRFMERCGAQGVSFIVTIILARLLDPETYGLVALVTVFTAILQVFVDGGLGSALIQKKDADDLDFSSVFYFNMGVCTLLYIGLFALAPAIAGFYGKPELISVIRVVAFTLVISGVKNVQQAYVSRHMLFKKFFFATLGGTIGAAVLGIGMAYAGLGVWALVVQSLFNAITDTVILWVMVKWRPKLMFSWKRLGGLLSYGWKLLVSGVSEVVYQKLQQLIIGKMYTAENLAFYNKGEHFPNLITTNINASIDSVLLPTLSKEQDNKERVKSMTRRSIKISTYIMMPLMVGLAVCAEPLIRLILGEEWLPCVPFMRIFCFSYAFYPIHTANLNAIKAMGRSDVFLKLEIVKKAVGLVTVFITMWISAEAMAYGILVVSILSQFINAFPNRRLLNYSFLSQLRDMLPQILLSAAMGAVVYCVTFLHLNNILTLLIQIPLGVLIYILGSKLFRIDSFDYIWTFLEVGLRKKPKREWE